MSWGGQNVAASVPAGLDSTFELIEWLLGRRALLSLCKQFLSGILVGGVYGVM